MLCDTDFPTHFVGNFICKPHFAKRMFVYDIFATLGRHSVTFLGTYLRDRISKSCAQFRKIMRMVTAHICAETSSLRNPFRERLPRYIYSTSFRDPIHETYFRGHFSETYFRNIIYGMICFAICLQMFCRDIFLGVYSPVHGPSLQKVTKKATGSSS